MLKKVIRASTRQVKRPESRPVPDKIYLHFGGGLGDVLYTYLLGKQKWGFLKSFKHKHPKTIVKLMSSTHNPQSLELVKYNPYIDERIEFGWVNDSKPLLKKNGKGYIDFRRMDWLTTKLDFERPFVYLSEQDNQQIVETSKNKPFIFVHPFAGLKDREPLSANSYVPIIDHLIDKLNYNVVVIGASHKRTNLQSIWDMKEEFSYERKGLANLVNKTNIRVAVQLARKAVGFIGCWSCFANVFWLENKKSLVLVPQDKKEKLNKRFNKNERWYKHGDCRVVSVGEIANIDTINKTISGFYLR